VHDALRDNNSTQYGLFAVVASTGLGLTYQIPSHFPSLLKGQLCRVPMRQGRNVRFFVGVFLQYTEPPDFNCVPVHSLLFEGMPIVLRPAVMDVLEWVARYYLSFFEKTISLAAPGFIWDEKKHKQIEKIILNFEKYTQKKKCVQKLLRKQKILPNTISQKASKKTSIDLGKFNFQIKTILLFSFQTDLY